MAAKPKRAPVTRERILRVALAAADEHGVDALKMRDLGSALGVEGMALYRHVANKDEIVDGILDLVFAEIEPPAATGDWVAAVRRSAISVYRALDRHPWAIGLLTDPSHLRPAYLEYMERLLGRLEDAGLSDDEGYHAYHVLTGYIVGFSLWLAGHTHLTDADRAARERAASMIAAADLPRLAKHHEQHRTEGPHHDVSPFEIGLDLILAGLAR